MWIFSVLMITLMTGTVLYFIYLMNKKHKMIKEFHMNEENFVIYHSSFFGIFELSSSIILFILFLIVFQLLDLFSIIIVLLVIFFLLVASYGNIKEKIVIRKELIYVDVVFCKTKIYKFSDIKKIEIKRFDRRPPLYCVYSEKHIFSVDSTSVAANWFLKKIKSRDVPIIEC